MLRLRTLIFITGVLNACSTLPNVKYSYYPAKSNTIVTVTQTIDCNNDKTSVVVVNTPSVTTGYSADSSKTPYEINIKDAEGYTGWFADSEIIFNFYDDGRLKSINQSTTGQGEVIVKSAVSLAAALAPLGGGRIPSAGAPTLPECNTIASWGGGKPVTLIYNTVINDAAIAATNKKPIPLPVSPGSKGLHDALVKQLPLLEVTVTDFSKIASRAADLGTSDVVKLTLQEIANVKVSITANGPPIWYANIILPGTGTYELPVPKAALFGNKHFL